VVSGDDMARVVQISDTHLSPRFGVPPQWEALAAWLHDDPPDLVVNTGDIVYEDPDDDADRDFARRLHDELDLALLFIPGNHDIGFYGEDAERPRRLTTFRATWGDDRFVADLAGWRIVGADAYLLGTAEHDDWLTGAVTTEQPVLVFVHQPLHGEPADGWEMPPAARAAYERATAGADVRMVASGHRHASKRDQRAAWAPSLTLTGSEEIAPGGDPRPGFVEFTLSSGGDLRHRIVRPWLD
jgi:alkaline phosphatase D